MRESLGKELAKSARQSARRAAPAIVRLAADQVKDVAKYPASLYGSEATSAPAVGAVRSLTRRPLVAGTLRLYGASSGTEYAPGSAFTEDAPGGAFTNLAIPAGASLTAHYHHYKGGGGGSTMSDQQVLEAVKRVDGPGSGLDADLLDGIGSSGFLQSLPAHGHMMGDLPAAADGEESAAKLLRSDDSRLRNLLRLDTTEIAIAGAATLSSEALNKMHVLSGVANYTVTLPAVAGNTGQVIGFRVASGATALVTIDGNAAETIDGQETRIMWAGESAVLLCDGTGWSKIAGKSRPMLGAIGGMAALQPVAAGGLVKLPLNTMLVDNTAAMVNTTNNRLNIPRSGTYILVPQITWSNLTNNVARLLTQVHKNNVYWYQTEHSGLASAYPGVAAVAPQSLAAGDYLELYAYQLGPGEQQVRSPIGETFMHAVERVQW